MCPILRHTQRPVVLEFHGVDVGRDEVALQDFSRRSVLGRAGTSMTKKGNVGKLIANITTDDLNVGIQKILTMIITSLWQLAWKLDLLNDVWSCGASSHTMLTFHHHIYFLKAHLIFPSLPALIMLTASTLKEQTSCYYYTASLIQIWTLNPSCPTCIDVVLFEDLSEKKKRRRIVIRIIHKKYRNMKYSTSSNNNDNNIW